MSYVIYKSDGSLFLTLEDGQLDTANTSLTLLGKNVINYGQYQNTNAVRMLENFASQNAPSNPLAGQLWFNKNSDTLRLNVYNGTSWKSLPNFTFSSTAPTLKNYDFWWNTDSQALYVQTTSTLALIGGPNVSVSSANKLTTARTINGVSFDGTSDIVVSANLTNELTFGSYISGDSFDGSVATTIDVDVGVVTTPTPNKVVARNENGDICFRIGTGTATAARYADLAEKYLTDMRYDAGTVMVVGGNAEVTSSSYGKRAIGVISENPGVMMNKDLEGGQYVALKGRVPVKISGSVTKSQRLVAGNDGRAVGVSGPNPDVFAVALEDSNGKDIIEALIL
jgi:hypothetical protein